MNYQRDPATLAYQIYGEIPQFSTVTEACAHIRDLKNSMNALFTENRNLNIINHDLRREIDRLEGLGLRQTTEVAEWKSLFQTYQKMAIDFAKELELLVPPKFDSFAPISLIA